MGGSVVPVIETERLRLRGHGLGDFDQCAEMWGDAEVTRFIGGRPSSKEEAWARMLRYIGHWNLLGFGYWVVEEKATGAFVGEVGLSEYRRELEPVDEEISAMPEVGWVLTPGQQGKGFAAEAVRAVIVWGWERFGWRPMACIISPEHGASIRVAERCGFERRGEVRYGGKTVVVFVMEGGVRERE